MTKCQCLFFQNDKVKFSKEISPIGNSPLWHSSLVYGNELLTIGGEFESKARLSSTLWKGLNLRWQNGSQFSRFASGGCAVKVAKDVFVLVGGIEQVKDSKVETNVVVQLNMCCKGSDIDFHSIFNVVI